MSCKTIRKLIDSTDRADVFPHEAARHLDSCGTCADFAEKRMRLRELLASSGRVAAPANFDAVLRVRLTERSASKPLPWLTPVLYLRFGGAAIALVCVFLLGQQFVRNTRLAPATGDSSNAIGQSMGTDGSGRAGGSGGVGETVTPPAVAGPNGGAPPVIGVTAYPSKAVDGYKPARGSRPRGDSGFRYVADVGDEIDPGARTAAVLLMRGPSAEREVMVPAVSVGAQPIFYSYREPQPSHGGRVSF
jgi:hypothetical protein